MKFTSITDRAITDKDNEVLDVDKYITALSNFIKHSATPLTVGIQGEWGSGKTSMMNMIRQDMEQSNVVTAWVNTWEYSLFREPSQIAPDCMSGLLQDLKKECLEKDTWPTELNNSVSKVSGFLRSIGKFALDAGVSTVTGKDGFSDAVLSDDEDKETRAEIAQIKDHISSIVQKLIDSNENPYKMAVFFVDDLDRIDPAVAVNVLEALKNLFDIPNCVFVLAIDYDVVVKGLEVKFGKKTEQNEREFRSFFDKIIQVPFTMPVASYNIEKMIEDRFSSIGFELPNEKVRAEYSTVVSHSVGTNPRSIKRYINTFSLLKSMSFIDDNSDDSDTDATTYDWVLFTLVGIQLAYPKVYRLIVQDHDMVSWDRTFAERNFVDLSKVPEDLKKNELYDEVWEQIVWAVCQKDVYMKTRSVYILKLLNMMRAKVGEDALPTILEKILSVTNITSVEDNEEVKAKKNAKFHFADFDEFRKAHLVSNYADEVLIAVREIVAEGVPMLEDKGYQPYVNFARGAVSINLKVPGRRKVIAYLNLRKKKLLVGFWESNYKKIEINSFEGMPEGWQEKLEQSAIRLTSGN